MTIKTDVEEQMKRVVPGEQQNVKGDEIFVTFSGFCCCCWSPRLQESSDATFEIFLHIV